MSEKNLEDFQSKQRELRKQKKAISGAIETKKKAIETEADNIEKLNRISVSYDAVLDMYEGLDANSVAQMGDPDYAVVTRPMSDLVASGVIIYDIRDQSTEELANAEWHNAMAGSTASVASVIIPSIDKVSLNYPEYFPHGKQIIEKYEPKKKLQEEIDYLEKQLQSIDQEVYEGFKAFLRKYTVGGAKTKYQDFIACRTMFFLRLIFGFSESKYGTKGRKEQIRHYWK